MGGIDSGGGGGGGGGEELPRWEGVFLGGKMMSKFLDSGEKVWIGFHQ